MSTWLSKADLSSVKFQINIGHTSVSINVELNGMEEIVFGLTHDIVLFMFLLNEQRFTPLTFLQMYVIFRRPIKMITTRGGVSLSMCPFHMCMKISCSVALPCTLGTWVLLVKVDVRLHMFFHVPVRGELLWAASVCWKEGIVLVYKKVVWFGDR